MSYKIVNNIIISLQNNNLSTLHYVINVLLYITLLTDNYNKQTMQDIYDELTPNFIRSVQNKFNFQMEIIDKDKFMKLCDINEIKNLTKNNDYIVMICNIFKTTKKISDNYEELSKYIIDSNTSTLMVNLIKQNKIKCNTIINLFSNTGQLINELMENVDNVKFIYGYEYNNLLNIICNLNVLLCSSNKNKILPTINYVNILTDNIKYPYADLVIANIPNNIKNLIYAKCCNNIKQYKIHGTKSEPLIMQLIISILNNNCSAILMIPDSFLFNDSSQHVLTRKQLIEKYNITDIINILSIKKSLIVLHNNGPTKSINMSTINEFNQNNDNMNIEINKILNNKYSFYHSKYDTINIENNNYEKIKLSNVIDIGDNNLSYNKQVLIYGNKEFNIIRLNDNDDIKYDNVFITKNEQVYKQQYLNNYLCQIFNIQKSIITKGKTNILDKEYIYNMELLIHNTDKQDSIISYIDNNKTIINQIKQQINSLNEIKNNLINTYFNEKNKCLLSSVCSIINEQNNKNMIHIKKNSNNAGYVSLSNNIENSNNKYYLKLNDGINQYVMFIIIKYMEPELIKLANYTNTAFLAKEVLENLLILNPNTLAEKEIMKLESIDQFISKLENMIETLSDSDMNRLVYL